MFDWQISLELELELERSRDEEAVLWQWPLRSTIFSHPENVYERSQEFRLMILLWLHLHEKRSPSPLSYVKHNLACLLFHNLLSKPSTMPPTKSSICLDYVVWIQLDRRDIFPVISTSTIVNLSLCGHSSPELSITAFN